MNTVCSCTYHLVLFYTFITSLAVFMSQMLPENKLKYRRRNKNSERQNVIMNSTYGTFNNNGTHRRMIMACVCSSKYKDMNDMNDVQCMFCCCSKLFVQTVCLAWLCFALFGFELSLVYFVFSVKMHVIKQQTLKCYWILLSERSCCTTKQQTTYLCALYFEWIGLIVWFIANCK